MHFSYLDHTEVVQLLIGKGLTTEKCSTRKLWAIGNNVSEDIK